MASTCNLVSTLDTVLYADTVEWCKDSRYSNVLALGTYQLNEETRLRIGGVQLYRLQEDSKGLQHCATTCSKSNDDIGVLDMRWSNGSTGPILLTANADHCIRMYNLNTNKISLSYNESLKLSSEDTSSLCLSLDVSDRQVVTSDSQGCIALIDTSNSGMSIGRHWKGHDHEAWVASFGSCDNNHLIISGGDDCKLCLWDIRQTDPLIIKKRHDMGVCCVSPHPNNHQLFASGSYDEIGSLWDHRNLSKPLKQISLGGGVWRLKWHPSHPTVMASASMHAGFHVLDWEKGIALERYTKEGELFLGYGIDWCTVNNELLAACSFYNHSLYLLKCQVN